MKKKIIIIDKCGIQNQPDFSSFGFVEFKEVCKCPENINKEDYDAALIHQRNKHEVFWADGNIRYLFVFSGDIGEYCNVYGESRRFHVPKESYDLKLIDFLSYYEMNGEIKPEIFL